MADENSRYCVTVTMAIQEMGTEKQPPRTIVEIPNLEYEAMHAAEVEISDAVRGVLVRWGDAIADDIKGKRKPK